MPQNSEMYPQGLKKNPIRVYSPSNKQVMQFNSYREALDNYDKMVSLSNKEYRKPEGSGGGYKAENDKAKTEGFKNAESVNMGPYTSALQAIILAPTRELANQINEEIQKLSAFEPIRSMSVYGGTSVGLQIKDFKSKKPQIVAGTPGRVMDLIDRGVLKFDQTKFVILDEADEMLDMGFFDDVTAIIAEVPEKRIWMFSATMPGPITDLVNREFSNPVTVKVTKKVLTADSVEQKAVVVRRENQIEAKGYRYGCSGSVCIVDSVSCCITVSWLVVCIIVESKLVIENI